MTIALVGCTSSSGVIPMGDDTYSIMVSAHSTLVPAGGIKEDAYKNAHKHCTALSKSLEEVSLNSSSGIATPPEVELKFRCI